MSEPDPIDPGHIAKRNMLRTIGPIILGVGILSLIVGLSDFFASVGTMRTPYLFFVGSFLALLIPIGLAITSMGYMGAVARYNAAEGAPVAKDTINYVADGVKPAITNMTTAIVEGINDADKGQFCTQCGHRNDSDAKFCKACGHAM